jgi:two-component system phosphate regulon response regulator PhoB
LRSAFVSIERRDDEERSQKTDGEIAMKRLKPEGSVLIGEDHPDTLRILKVVFESEGYPVDTAPDSETVLVKAIRNKPLIILLDMMLPKIGGVEVCRRLKEEISTAHIPIVIVTAKSDQEAKAGAAAAGADAYVLKPFDPTDLIETVNKILGRIPVVPLPQWT